MNTSELKNAVTKQILESTALQVSTEVVKAGQDLMQEELQTSHFLTIGMIEVDNVVDDEREALEDRLDELNKLNTKHNKELNDRKAALAKEIKHTTERLKRTEVRRHYRTAFKALERVPYLDQPFIEGDPDKEISIDCSLPNPVSEDPTEAEGYFEWSFNITTEGPSYSRKTLSFAGKRSISKKILKKHEDVRAVEDKLNQLTACNREVRQAMQELERDRERLRRKVRKQAAGKSVVGSEIRKILKAERGNRKLLPIPQGLK